MAHNLEILKRIEEIIKLLEDFLSEEEDTNTSSKNVDETIIKYAYPDEGEGRNDDNEEFHETYDDNDIDVEVAEGPQTTQIIPQLLIFAAPIIADAVAKVVMSLISSYFDKKEEDKLTTNQGCPPIPPWCYPHAAPYAQPYDAPYAPPSHEFINHQQMKFQAPYQPPPPPEMGPSRPQNLAPNTTHLPPPQDPVALLPGPQLGTPQRTQASKPPGDRKLEDSPSPTKAMRQGAPRTTKSSPPDRRHRAPQDPYETFVMQPGQTFEQPDAPELSTIFDTENQWSREAAVIKKGIRQPSKGARGSSPAKKKDYSRSISVIDQLYNDIIELEKRINETIEEIIMTHKR